MEGRPGLTDDVILKGINKLGNTQFCPAKPLGSLWWYGITAGRELLQSDG